MSNEIAHEILDTAWESVLDNAESLKMLGQELIRTRQECDAGKESIDKFIEDFYAWHKLNMAFYAEVQHVSELCALYRAMIGKA